LTIAPRDARKKGSAVLVAVAAVNRFIRNISDHAARSSSPTFRH
jgi:hypothetical protein